ncbi:YHS domain-containing protein [Thermodesulfobacteriota bacterium]
MRHSVTSNQISFIDPVCNMQVPHGNNNLRVTYKMRTYYFCSAACRSAFEADPEKYLNPTPRKPKGWWGRYLDRLQKATGGKAQKCH